MATQQLNPNADVSNSNASLTGAANYFTALSDTSDASYATLGVGTGGALVICDLTSYTLTGTQRCMGARARARWAATDAVDFLYGMADATNTLYGWTSTTADKNDVITTDAAGSFTPREFSQAEINAMRLYLFDQGTPVPQGRPKVYESYVELDIRTQVTVATVLPSGGSNPGATRRPTVSWAFTDPDGGTQKSFQVLIKRASDNAIMYDSGQVVSSANSHQITTTLADGTYYAQVLASKDFLGADWWSTAVNSAANFTIAAVPPTPTLVTPGSGGLTTVTTDIPTLTSRMSESPTLAYPARVKAEWQLATDAGFTTQLRTVTEPDSDLRIRTAPPGASLEEFTASEVVPVASQLFQGTWFIRARGVDEFGTVGSWTTAQSFTVTHPPAATNLSPTGNVYRDWGGAGSITFSWTFTDPSPVDSQTKYEIAVERNDTGAAVVASPAGGTASTAMSGALTIPAAQKDQPLRWKIRLYDSDGVAGAYSDYQLFRVGDKPVHAITAPTNASTVNNPTPTTTWTFTAAGGRTQAKYRLIYKKGTATVLDTGWLTGTALTYTPASALYNNGDSGSVTVQVEDNVGLQSTATTNTFTVSYTAPITVGVLLDASGVDTVGYTRISWQSNLNTNNQASVETDTAGIFSHTGGASVTRVTTQFLDGAASVRWASNTTGSSSIRLGNAVGTYAPVVAGLAYTALAWGRNDAANATVRNMAVDVTWIDSGGAAIGSAVNGTSTPTTNNSWTALTNGPITAPVGAVYARVQVRGVATTSGDLFYADQMGIFRGSAPAWTMTDAAFYSWRVYRRPLGSTTWTLLTEILSRTTTEYFDYTAGANTTYEYAVVQCATRFGVVVESAYVPTQVTVAGTDYWLIHPTDHTLDIRLPQVVSDDYAEEYEQETLLLIGRGRKADIGTRWGYRGSLTAQLYDITSGLTARQQKAYIEALKASRSSLYLRTPFGDVWQVSTENIQVSRIGGVGVREFCTVTIPYFEVA